MSRAAKVQQLELDLAFYEGQAERTRIKLEEMRFPKEPKGQGTVIKFLVQFDPEGQVYQYWAARLTSDSVDKRWAITGKTGTYAWTDVVTFMRNDISVRLGARDIEFSVVSK